MTTINKKSLALEIRNMINKTPQRHLIDDDMINAWTMSVLEREPERAIWHASRLLGFGGSEIGVLVGYEKGEFHPYDQPTDIIKRKLLREGLTESNGHLERGTTMEPIAQKKYLTKIAQRGARSILDKKLAKIISEYKNDEHPWLVGNPDDIIMEKNGDVYIVDYKVPTPDSFEHIVTRGVPYYYDAQLHHYKIILDDLYKQKKIDFKIKGLRLVPFDIIAFEAIELPVVLKKTLEKEILNVGGKYWNDYLLKNKLPPRYVLKDKEDIENLEFVLYDEDEDGNLKEIDFKEIKDESIVELPEEQRMLRITTQNLKDKLKNQVGKNYLYAQMAVAAEEQRKSTTAVISQMLPKNILTNSDIDYIDYLGVKIKIQKEYDVEKLLDIIYKITEDLNLDKKNLKDILEDPKNKTETKYDMKTLKDILKLNNVDLDSQNWKEKIQSSIIEEPKYRTDVLVSLIGKLDVKKEYPLHHAVIVPKTSVSVIMPRDGGCVNEDKKTVRNDFKINHINPYMEEKMPIILDNRNNNIQEMKNQIEKEKAEKERKRKIREENKRKKQNKLK